ncbi:hypothetical protein COCSADRAFT_146826 [Bipolaris sorokiniana ND90Pr]|nr:uncharacterized protein COCSADRAFT_146826 [Bipolaris sorokiniana ND90Pr]EMD62748.1 hypothetical protein COCSADRAFT_146826 [Bipolaris sorokiniana ND90Pr]
MGKRRSHTKSRNGCIQCKRRRIKCDEEKSGCGYCMRRGTRCVFPRFSKISAPATLSLPVTPHAPTISACSPGLSDCSTLHTFAKISPRNFDDGGELDSFTMNDLILLHHWSLVTSLTMVNTPGVDHIWQTVMVQIGAQHPYVMHGIFSLTALHLAYLDSTKKHTLIATAAQHHNRALRDFQTKLCNINEEDSDALFASASINMLYVFATFGNLYYGDANESPADYRSRILGEDWIPLIRGVNRLIQQIREVVNVGPLSSLLRIGNWNELDPDAVSVPYDAELQSLKSIWADSADALVYDESLYLLRKCWAWTTLFQSISKHLFPDVAPHPDWEYNRSWSGPFIWLSLAPDDFFLRLQQRHPAALILFAHFGGLSAGLEGYWWMEGWGKNIVAAVNDILGSYWDARIELPRRLVARTGDEIPGKLG